MHSNLALLILAILLIVSIILSACCSLLRLGFLQVFHQLKQRGMCIMSSSFISSFQFEGVEQVVRLDADV